MHAGLDNAELSAIEAELPKRRWNGKRLCLAGALTLLALSAAALLYHFYQPTTFPEPPTYVEVPEMMVNLETGDTRARYLKVKLVIEAASAEDGAEIRTRMPGVMDGFQTFLRQLRPEDLEGATGSYLIKEEMLARVNSAASPATANHVLIQELIQQ